MELTFSFNFKQKRGVTQENEFLILEIHDIARGGAGVAREPSGRIVFVPKTAPGDQVRVRIIHEEKKYAQAELVEVLRPSPMRREPRCPVFGKCGGCSWQHIPYEHQWKTKVSGVRHALTRVQVDLDSVSAPVEEHPAERIWEYRNRVQLRGEGERIGFHAPGSREIVAIRRCDIARPEINSAIEEARCEGARLRKPYKVELALQENGELRKVWNSRHGAAGFRQVHDEQNEKLRSWVAGHVPDGAVLFDLYGGSGNLSLGIASRLSEIHCVDVSSPRERPAGTPEHYKFHRADVLSWLSGGRGNKPPETGDFATGRQRVAVLDPPREGLADAFSEVEAGLVRLGVDRLLAVGCDPDAWARDLHRFLRRGWKIEQVAFFDFFPHTPHIESAALLRRHL